ncbi:MAG TPA: hypothetical protein VKC54_02115 [Patescibacteria group bacterium]|nr:hypothetical protein [Patescibacteria group bacterium]
MIKNKKQKGFAPILIILILVLLGITALIVSKINLRKTVSTENATFPQNLFNFTPAPSAAVEPSPTPLPVVLKSSQISWIEPVRVANLGVFKNASEIKKAYDIEFPDGSQSGPPDPSKFYFIKVADLSDGSILVNGYTPKSFSSYGVYYINFIVKGGSVKAILDGVGYYRDDAEMILSPNIPIEHGRIEGLDMPQTLIVNNLQLYGSDYPAFEEFNALVSPAKLADTSSGSVYVIYNHVVAPNPVFDRIFYLKLKDGLVVRYSVDASKYRYDNSVQKFKWSSGVANDVAFAASPFWGGCGGSSNASSQVIKSSDIGAVQKETVGTDANNNPVYKLADSSSAVLKEAYKQYNDSHTGLNNDAPVSYNDFLNDKNNILIKDAFNDWVFYLNPKYAQLAECGKPVIYLYPTQKENVNVQVGAKITQSNPSYPVNGWTVLASPDGALSYNGTTYPYLFWEGLGNGIYPEVKNRGVVVKKEDVENKLKEDLKSQGLNEKETSDFLDFWLPKISNKPYVRLTWLNTLEMNNLAPLTVSPKPDTMIRVFLDFEGLDQPVNLIPQKLFAPQRKGFTLIEWGGLLIK